jgi:cysteine desulfurase
MTAPSRVYLDHAATSPVRSEVRAAVLAAMEIAGNPSSVHAEGRQARALVERARDVIRQALGGAGAGEIIFTSGATEANAMALGGQGVILASAVEHPSVLARADIETVPVDSHGQIDLEALEQRLSQGDVCRLALMLANNETGVVQPVAAAGRLARAAGVRLHVDAVQALGKLGIDVDALGCDSLALSAHKIGGPKGIGALWLRDGLSVPPLLVGGGQEGRRRAGTENIVGIAGFAAAVEALTEAELVEIATLRGSLEAGVRGIASDALIIACRAERVAHISAMALPGMAAATQVMALDLAGIAVSAGAACSSGKVARSHVLESMNLPLELVESTIRVSIGWSNTTADIDRFLEAWGDLARRRRLSAA